MKKYILVLILLILGATYYVKFVSCKCTRTVHVKADMFGKKNYICFRKKSSLVFGQEDKSPKQISCDYCGCPASDHDEK